MKNNSAQSGQKIMLLFYDTMYRIVMNVIRLK